MASTTGTLYIGFTNNLIKRVYEHKANKLEGFTKKYKCHKLVYYEYFTYVNAAIKMEKELKGWKRDRKIELINAVNPKWNDLIYEIT